VSQPIDGRSRCFLAFWEPRMVHLSVVITAVNGGLLSRARLDDKSRTMYKIDRQFSWRGTRRRPRGL
jgi:hypothetical protein